jgi:ankyrin repeat protein
VKREKNHKVVEWILDATVKATRDENIFNDDMEAAIQCLEQAQSFYSDDHSKNEILLQKLLNGKLKTVLEDYGLRLLHFYIASDIFSQFESAKFMLSQKFKRFDLNEFYDGKNCFLVALSQAITRFSNKVLLPMLLDYQPIEDYNAADEDGKTIFMYFCEFCQDENVIREIIAKTPDCVHRKTKNGSTCMHFFHLNSECNDAMIKFLIVNGADDQTMNDSGFKPLALAAMSSNHKLFSTLLSFEPDEDLNKKFGAKQSSLLHLVLDSWNAYPIEELLERGVDFSAIDTDFNTPLHIIQCDERYQSCLKFIKENKIAVNVNLQNKSGETPLMIAMSAKKHSLAKSILEIFYDEIDFELKNAKNQTMIHMIIQSISLEQFSFYLDWYRKFFKLFQEQFANEDKEGITPLWFLINGMEWAGPPQFNVFVKYLSLENLEKHFHMFVNHDEGLKEIFTQHPNFFADDDDALRLLNSSINHINDKEAFDYLLTKTTNEIVANVRVGNKNILHLICEKNDQEIIDSLVKFLSDKQFELLKKETDDEGQKPFDLLNNDNKNLFDEVFA